MAANPPDLDQEQIEVEVQKPDGSVERHRGIFTSYRLTSNYMVPSDEWDFTVFSDENPFELRRIWQPLQPIKIYVSGNLQVIGRIDDIEGTDDSGTELRVHGRDYLADIVDANIDPQYRVRKDQDIGSVLLEIFKPFGITTVLGSFNLTRNILTGKRPYFGNPERTFQDAKLDDFKPDDGQGVMDFAMKIVARHGFTILPAGTRDSVVVDAPNYLQEAAYNFSRPGNLLGGKARRDYSMVPTIAITRGRASDSAGNVNIAALRNELALIGAELSTAPTADAVEQFTYLKRKISDAQAAQAQAAKDARGQATTSSSAELSRILANVITRRFDPKNGTAPTNGELYRPLYRHDKDSRNQEQHDRALRRAMAEKIRGTLEYTAKFRGHNESETGTTFAIDTMANVSDTVEDVSEKLWVYERTFYNDGHSGPQTDLKLLRPESYVI
jgi:prophage tail gpP-like protein